MPSIGARVGPYEITELLGVGGMGEVYRATDTKLKREVAVKVLPAALTADPDRLARFQREGEVLASLNHANIASIYGLEEADGVRALVMELVDGPTLADRIVHGPISLDEALPIARQIAEALEAAHEHGIIHRDLKPANIKVRRDGTVKVLDFGLAKLLGVPSNDGGISQSPTVTREAMTRSGVILGTPAYVSPEQAKNRAVDERTDIWGLGCVLYEMLTGRAAFAQETIPETLARVIEREPDWDALPANTPPNIKRLVRRCLEKDPRRRLHAAADVRIAIEDAFVAHDTDSPAIPQRSRWSTAVVPWLIASIAIAVAVIAVWSTARRSTPDLAMLRLDVNTAPTRDPVSFSLAPDGRRLVFVALEQQTPTLWLRPLDQAVPQRLAETEGASLPFWAPGSRSIGFFADGWLKRLDLTGGSGRPQLLAQARNPMGGTWNRDDMILYSPTAASPLMRVPAIGGTPTAITRLAPGEVSHRFPAFLPDGQQFVFLVLTSAPEDEGVHLGSLPDAPDRRHRVIAVNSAAEYATPGYLLVVREGMLIGIPFDARKGTVSGDPLVLASQVASDHQRERGAFSVSATGLVAYRMGSVTSPATELAWIRRDGSVIGTLPATGFPTLTTDGHHIAVSQQTQLRTFSNTDIWLIDTARGVPRRFTFDPAFDVNPVWSPDGSRLVFASNRKGVFDLFEKPVSFARDEGVLLQTPENKVPNDWSPDGQVLLFLNENAVTGDDLWTVSVQEPHELVRVLNGSHAESQGQFSPDGRWLAYRSNESGRWEIYVRPYPGPGGQQLVSSGGGVQPRWRRDGNELFYIAADSRMMAVPIQLPSNGDALEAGMPMPLFTAKLTYPSNQQFGYAVDPAGQRFLMWIVDDQTSTTPITIVQHWTPGLPY
jgi:serine/threonine protein kinase/Tol biopolymer transport system component